MKIANKSVTETAVVFDFADGTTVECDISQVNEAILYRLALHGLSQKVGDSYSGAESVAEAIGAARSVWSNLTEGQWAVRAARGGKIVEALARVTGKDYDECLEVYAGMTDAEKKDLRKHPQIKQAMAEIELERAQAAASQPVEGGADLGKLF